MKNVFLIINFLSKAESYLLYIPVSYVDVFSPFTSGWTWVDFYNVFDSSTTDSIKHLQYALI